MIQISVILGPDADSMLRNKYVMQNMSQVILELISSISPTTALEEITYSATSMNVVDTFTIGIADVTVQIIYDTETPGLGCVNAATQQECLDRVAASIQEFLANQNILASTLMRLEPQSGCVWVATKLPSLYRVA